MDKFKSRSAIALFTGLVLVAGSPALLAEPKGKDDHTQSHGQHPGKGGPGRGDDAPQVHKPQGGGPSHGDSRDDFRIDHDRIRVTIGGSRDYWSPGPALPPGVRKNLQRGKPLPPGIAKQQLDSRLISRLPYHEGYEWLRVGTDLVQVSISSRMINEVLNDVFD